MAKVYLYQKIEEELIGRILSGRYEVNSIVPGTKDLAKEFSTSGVTIDRALSSLVERGYVSRTARKGTFVLPEESWEAGGSLPGDIAIILHQSPSPYFWPRALQGINYTVEQHRRHLVVGNHYGDFEETKTFVRNLRERNIAGLIYVPVSTPSQDLYLKENRSIIRVAEEINLPYVLFDRYLDPGLSNHVVSNDFEAAAVLTQTLLDNGCKKPLCLTHMVASSFNERERGFMETLKRNSYSDLNRCIYRIDTSCPFVEEDHIDEIVDLIETRDVDGVLAVNADLLIAAMGAANSRLDPSKRPAFVNFDDVGMFRDEKLLMSAVQKAYDHGKLVADLLISLVEKWNNTLFQVVHPFEFRRYPSSD